MATGMPEHVRVSLEPKFGFEARSLHHAGETGSRKWRAPLRREHEGRLWLLFAL